MFLQNIHCASTRNAQRKHVACTIRPGRCRQKSLITDQPSILLPGRTASARVSVKSGAYKRHGAFRRSMTTFHKET